MDNLARLNVVRFDRFKHKKVDEDYYNVAGKFISRYDGDTTGRAYKRAILDFFCVDKLDGITIEHLQNVTVSDVEDYYNQMINGVKKPSKSKVDQNKSALSGLYDYVISKYQSKVLSYNPFNNIVIRDQIKLSMPKEDDMPKGEILHQEQVDGIYKAIENDTETSEYKKLRDKTIFRFMLNTSLRRNEVVKAKFNNFRQINGDWFFEVIEGKGRKNREVWVDESVVEDIKILNPNAVIGESDWSIFGLATGNAINEIVKKWCSAIGINDGMSAHQLRHTSLTWIVQAAIKEEGRISEFELIRHAGWNSIETAKKYIHSVDLHENAAGKLLKKSLKF